jgi:internalin A
MPFGIVVEYLITQRWPGLRHDFLISVSAAALRHPCSGSFSHAGLRRFRELCKTHVDRHVCAQPQEVSRLFTGFELITTPLDEKPGQIMRHLEEVEADQRRTAAVTAETAVQVRGALKILSVEIIDCPRLFTVELIDSKRRLRWNDRFKLTLCGEYPGHEHPWAPAAYDFTRPRTGTATYCPTRSLSAGCSTWRCR